jgi:hypothetical protein
VYFLQDEEFSDLDMGELLENEEVDILDYIEFDGMYSSSDEEECEIASDDCVSLQERRIVHEADVRNNTIKGNNEEFHHKMAKSNLLSL